MKREGIVSAEYWTIKMYSSPALRVLAVLTGFLFSLSVAFSAEKSSVRIRLVDSATGYAVQPTTIEAKSRAGNKGAQRLNSASFHAGGDAVMSLEQGSHMVTVDAPGYLRMSGAFEMSPNNPYTIVFQLDPLVPPREIQPDYVSKLHRVEETVFVGYVVDDDSGQPLANAVVRTEPSERETRTDERGYFQIYVPVQTLAEATQSPASLSFSQAGFRTEEYRYLELWSEGDRVYRIRLQPGDGRNVVDERQLRRRSHYPLHVKGEGAKSGTTDTPSTTPTGNSEVEGGDGPIIQNAFTPPAIRIPTNIRVLRQDGVTIDYISLQTYCQRSLPSEWIASWGSTGPGNSGTNSLLAGAVAIRTYAIGFVNNPSSTFYDICGTTSCQAYIHTASDSRTTAAVNATANYVMNQPGAARIGFKITEYSAENNSLGFACGDGFTQPTGGCIADPVCTGEERFGHGRGMCQWGTARWASGRRMAGRVTSDATTNGLPIQNWTWLCEHYYPNLELVQGAPLQINDYVQVLGTSSLTVRQCADGSISSGTNCPQVTTKTSGSTGIIIGGPVRVTSDGVGYTWWRVQWFDGSSTMGWSPENWLERTTEPTTVPPVLATIPNVAINEGTLLTFTNSAVSAPLAETLLTDFEGFASGTANGSVLFRQPTFSGSTSPLLDASPNLTSVTGTFPSGNDSARVLRANWSWTNTANLWLRLTTSGTANLPNPVIDLTRKLKFDIHSDKAIGVAIGIRETGNPAGTAIGSNGGTTPAIIEFAGVTNVVSGQPQVTRTVSPSNWTTLEFDLPNEPIRNFVGGNGVLSTATGLGVLEHLAFVPAAGSGPYDVYLDNFVVSAPKVLTYSLSNAPAGATINATNGVFTWTPTEVQGPGVYNITVRVTDNNLPPLSDAKTFQVTVNEVNLAPSLAAITNRVVHAGTLVTFTNAATDPDLPANNLSFSLDAGAPPTASVGGSSGIFTWQTSDADTATTNSITARVTDNGVPPLNDTETFSVTVLARPTIQNTAVVGSDFVLDWSAIPGTKYRVQFKSNLDDPVWIDLTPDVTALDNNAGFTDPLGSSQRFYRIQVVP
ncbi:MAG TPA: putative Ig domain-containing protein [Verrucomicrobiae bacterium]|nr:putative Ig domain-containing protein [Verrucomicrobiae bacterium]